MEIKNYQIEKIIKGKQKQIWEVKFSSRGNIIAASSGSSTIDLWHTGNYNYYKAITNSLNKKNLYFSLDFNQWNNHLATGNWDLVVDIWNISKSKTPIYSLTDHRDSIVLVSYSTNGKILCFFVK